MKKILFITMLFLSVPAVAIDCPKGRVVKNKGGDICASLDNFNWYTAFSWCQSQGMHLLTAAEVCGADWSGDRGDGACPDLVDAGNTTGFYAWTATPHRTHQAFGITISNGGIHIYDRLVGYGGHMGAALCR